MAPKLIHWVIWLAAWAGLTFVFNLTPREIFVAIFAVTITLLALWINEKLIIRFPARPSSP